MTPDAVRKLALALPEAAEAPHHDMTSFRVRGRIFATMPASGQWLHVFITDNERELAIAMHPQWIAPLLWGGSVRGVRIDLARARPKVIAGLLEDAWRAKAPKRLAGSSAAPPAAGRPRR